MLAYPMKRDNNLMHKRPTESVMTDRSISSRPGVVAVVVAVVVVVATVLFDFRFTSVLAFSFNFFV